MQHETVLIKFIELFNESTTEQRHLGLNWYLRANGAAKRISKLTGVSIPKVCGVISALSPNNKWERNLFDAELFINNPSLETKVCTYTANRVKALKILGTPNDSDIINILGGTKTKSFYSNILNKNSETVTVDLWMYRAAELSMSDKNYKLISGVITELAAMVNLKPYQVQAVLWGVIRDRQTKAASNDDKIAHSIAS